MEYTIRQALQAMGYHEERDGIWLKPVGYHAFGYNESKKQWFNWFRDMQGEISLYESHILKDIYDPLSQLKSWEAYTRISVAAQSDSQFELRVPSEL